MIFPSSSTAALLALILGMVSAVANAQDAAGSRANLLPNGTFEKGLDGWKVHPFHKNGTAAMDETEKRDGKPALKAYNAKGDDMMITVKITVKPQTRYRLTGYIKTKDVIPDAKNGKTGASLAITGGFEHTEMVMKTKPWSKVTMEFESGNKTEIELGPRLGHYSNSVTGTAWFADLSVVELGKARK